ncbi:hypothetical protein Tco_1192796 [Tanacetum coccineum]
MSENEDKYHKKNADVVLKIGNSLQGMFMLEPKQMSFYDSNSKHDLGYANSYTLKKAISQNPKLYDASCFDDSKIHVNIRYTEDILDDATKSQIKMKNKLKDPIAIEKKQNVCTINYKKLNSLYEDFVSQKEFSAEQKYFSSSFISSENPSNANSSSSPSETKPNVAPMPSANPMKLDLNKMENDFKTLFALLQTNSKRESIFYTSLEEIRLTKFCQQEVKPILHNETWKQNELLKDQLLEAKLKHEIECCVLLSHECVNNNVQDEIEKIQRDSIEIQEAKDVLCVSCAKNVLILCHDKCLTNYKLNVHSKVRRAIFTTPRIAKSVFEDTTPVVSKTRFSVKTTQSESLDTTSVVSRTKIATVTPLRGRKKVVQIILWIVNSGCLKHMTGDRSLLKNFVEKFMGTARFGNDHFAAITGYGDYDNFLIGDLEVLFRLNYCYVRINLEGDDFFTGARESNLYIIFSISDMAASSCFFTCLSSLQIHFNKVMVMAPQTLTS